VVSVESVGAGGEAEGEGGRRVVRLRVRGVEGGERGRREIGKVVEGMGAEVVMEEEEGDREGGEVVVMEVAYVPDAPRLTIRSVLAAVEAVSPALRVEFVQPRSVEENAQRMHREEEFRLRIRIIFTFLVAIPTFLVGVVFTSLVKKESKIRSYLEAEAWVGRTTRAQWALFILATPVMFFGADIFHRRSAKELWALWKRGSTVPVWKRFVRFGSMNLLVRFGPQIEISLTCPGRTGCFDCLYCIFGAAHH